MAKKSEQLESLNEQEAFDIIELTLEDMDLLTRAFNLITELCLEEDVDEDSSESLPSLMIH